jgi:hypothetical protein
MADMRRGTCVAIALLACAACTPAKEIVQPERDQVAFFERPVALTAARNSSVPAPLIVLIESDPWAMVLGSDSPSFAMYEDGTVIRRIGDGFTKGHLTPAQQSAFIEALKPTALRRWYGRSLALFVTDQPDQDLLFYTEKEPLFVSVYGSLDTADVRAVVAPEIVDAYDKIKGFKATGEPWLPDFIEVMISPYEYAPDASIKWPADFPSLDDPNTIRRGDDQMSLFVPSARYDQLRTFLKGRKERGAVEIGGKKWSAHLRFPFPQEQLWMSPNRELKDSNR